MQRPRPEGKDNAARTRSHTTIPDVAVIVLSDDPALLAVLREAAGDSQRILSAKSPESAVDLLVGGHCGIFVVDLAAVRGNAVELIDKLLSQFPEVVLLATGRRQEQNAVTSLIGNGRIYRFLHKPVSPARAELFLSAGIRRYRELYSGEQPTESSERSSSSRRLVYAGVVACVLAMIAALAYWRWPEPIAVRSDDTPPSIAPTSTVNAELIDLLARADAARADGEILPPAQPNAFDLYRGALRIDPQNARALQAIAEMSSSFVRQANEALEKRDAPAARVAVTNLQQVAPDHPQLATLTSHLVSLSRQVARPAPPAAERQAPNAPAPTPRPAAPNVDIARAYLEANQLIEPADASALGALREARSSGDDESAIQLVATDLGMRLLSRASASIESKDLAAAKTMLAAAVAVDREFETGLPDIETVARLLADTEAALQREARSESLARAARLRVSGQLIDPPGENALEVLQGVLAQDAASSEAKLEQERLSLALLEHTRTALAAGEIDRADVLASRAEALRPGLPQTRALREQIGTARARREEGTLVQAANLPRRREVPAVYPRDALLSRTEGWVNLEFVLGTDGVPRDIRVTASQPLRTFDGAAIQALRQWRFEPIVVDGAPQARRATLRIEFKLQR